MKFHLNVIFGLWYTYTYTFSQFKPLEQLMGVFPAGSKKFLPTTWQTLMFEADSPIIDFYPTDFKIDLNGKKYAWQGRCAEIESVRDDVT